VVENVFPITTFTIYNLITPPNFHVFTDATSLLEHNPPGRYYGVAALDVDGDGETEFLVAGFGCPNRVLKWNGVQLRDVTPPELADPLRATVGVAAGDLDGDGREEIYLLNTDTFAGTKRFCDRLMKARADGTWLDLFDRPENLHVRNFSAGRSVAVLDRRGVGRYGFFVANYGRPMRMYELSPAGALVDLAPALGLSRVTGGRGLLAAPLMGHATDLVCVNENGPNFFFRNSGDGTFEECAVALHLDDPAEHARGVTTLDLDGDGRLDLAWVNWEGPHRLMARQQDGTFRNVATPGYAFPSAARTIVAADFDNDGHDEILINNLGEPNRLFRVDQQAGSQGLRVVMLLADALQQPNRFGTGAAVADVDGDGILELLIAHGESDGQTLQFCKVSGCSANRWLRVKPLTRFGAPARGAIVQVEANGRLLTKLIDAGSGYLCQMEPVAHFGLGAAPNVRKLTVTWPDGTALVMHDPGFDRLLIVPYPRG